jgi:hypothetical protein
LSKVIGNLEGISLRISQQGDKAVKGVSDIMQKNGVLIRDLAIEYAPVETGALEDSIRKNTTNTGINRRSEVEIFIDESGDAGKYARNVHEHLAPFGDGTWGTVGQSDPNSLSMQKDGGRGVVGGLFLTRAFLFYKDKIRRDSEKIIKRAFSE